MIISASRRTDIPAFYSEWFIKRLHKGYLLVRNPMNRLLVSRIPLSPEITECIVFWSKNPAPIIPHLKELNDYNYYFHFTINSYGNRIERNLPPKDKIINTFKKLSDLIGPERVIWRYDPVFYVGRDNFDSHIRNFEILSRSLEGYTLKCMYSFLTVYKKCERNMKGLDFSRPEHDDMVRLSEFFYESSRNAGIILQTCAEESDLLPGKISPGKCIDDELISRIAGRKVLTPPDRNQRKACNCVTSIDVGAYNTCINRCLYCYANFDHNKAEINYHNHDPEADMITGKLDGTEKIMERGTGNSNVFQYDLFSNTDDS